MPMHHTPLIATIVAGLVIAFIMGSIAHKLKVSPIAGYLLAGILVGPHTPGFVGDGDLAAELAEIGVILLMFGVGLHFSLRDLLSVKNVAVPGAIGQIAVATLMGMGLSWTMGWDPLAGFVFGLALSVASTVVLLRALQGFGIVDTERGRIAVGWLIVEDLVMVLALVLLPALAEVMKGDAPASWSALLVPLAQTGFKITGFLFVMLVVGRRVIPWALHWVVHTGSRELFRLAVLAIALGVAFGAAVVFDVSFALGAFFAGMILGETPLSRQATEETLPLRDAFAVLFFVSVGMLFNPQIVVDQPLALVATVLIIVFGKSVAAYFIVRALKHSHRTAITAAASLAQIGEFSFILATLGTSLAILPPAGRDLILAGALLSIFVNPFIFNWFVPKRQEKTDPVEMPADTADLRDHVVLIGYGRVGKLIARDLKARDRAFILIEDQADTAREAKEAGLNVVRGNALDPAALEAAGIERASKLLIAIPEGFEGGAVVEAVRKLNPGIAIVARAHSEAEVAHLEGAGAGEVVMGEREIANRMLSICAVPLARQP
ncbi:Kef family K(+) transporter [Sphingomonas koreensis]|uniref:Cation:proton antiport protein n=2 Tax=Sphingomonas koreensis TaxID=93064 RepID=A0A1L6JDR5_9SPHN|nr:YbaL family putative K(+) efflux transporter [Sphingomonas koreensis]APR53640.1 cation:proton antiport protein [Sphingomonas koreensis]MDC7809622.1 YbaL family putative K(+) efflux transporter [Sphingomonas koreensis]RSU24231.1 Kef family K(+) transporter [Sphingomonas koreensis]RSU25933.1 Kef family K(+) transporter [Sphingomonas koreensis]RSU26013.1 Kef family K(+) transporter [Sphingomonas koreensis]